MISRMKWTIVDEGQISIKVPTQKIVTKDMPVFYNPVMALNRSLMILLLKSLDKKALKIADPLAGTGVRALRLLKELPKSMIKKIYVNDLNPKLKTMLASEAKRNKITLGKVEVNKTEASVFLLEHKGMDYIDIDPFGSPNPFLDAACKRINRSGILAVTATDTAALTGTYPKASRRKYDAIPLRNELMHEIGMRILIRKVQLIGAQYEKALTPIFVHANKHYYRAYFHCEKSRSKVDSMLKQHTMVETAGPLWTGTLWDRSLVKKMMSHTDNDDITKMLTTIYNESAIKTVGFFDIHRECKRLKTSSPKTTTILEQIKKKKHKAAITHFSPTGIRTTLPKKSFQTILKKN